MSVRQLTSTDEQKKYDTWIKAHPQGNLWQSLERKAYLDSLEKETRLYIDEEDGSIVASALVKIDRTSFGLSTWDIGRGPLGDAASLLDAIVRDAQADRCLAVYFSPLKIIDTPSQTSSRHIHCSATRMIDLTQTEEEILAQMKQKGRYNIRVAEKHGVTVENSDDVDAFYQLISQTGQRDDFTILPQKQYQAFLDHLTDAFLLIARSSDGVPAAGLMGVRWNGTGIYYYGASSYEHRALMAPYLLQWEAIQHCKQAGCSRYDLLGIAPLEAPSDHPWQGISSFKEKFGGEVIDYPDEQQIVLRPVVKWLLSLKRRLL